jgi:hypothetical protein
MRTERERTTGAGRKAHAAKVTVCADDLSLRDQWFAQTPVPDLAKAPVQR